MPDKDFTFHGLTFGMTVAEVKAAEALRSDTILSPTPSLRPGYETYWYYLIDGTVGILQYTFNSENRLASIMIILMGPPIDEAEAISTIKALEPIFDSAFGAPKKYSDITYGWFTPALNCFMFAWPSNNTSDPAAITTEMFINYTSPESYSDDEISKIREDMIKYEESARKSLEQALQ